MRMNFIFLHFSRSNEARTIAVCHVMIKRLICSVAFLTRSQRTNASFLSSTTNRNLQIINLAMGSRSGRGACGKVVI